MKKIIKTSLLILTILLLASCGNKNTEVTTTEAVEQVVSLRNIIVSEINGKATVTHNDGQKLDAYEGMSLYDGDDVVVEEKSNLTLSIDSDKHLFADENSHFRLTATGEEGKTKTIIHLNEGSVLCDIKEKLKDDESFDIHTASTTMCVRGTVFRVCLLKGNDNSVFDLVEVYDGKVWSNIENSEENLTLEPGQCALVRKTDSAEEAAASFVLAEDINDKFVEETGLNISLDQAENAEKGAMKISLENVPVDTLSRLETIIDEGTELVVEKEKIQEAKEIIETKKEEPKPEQKKEEPKVEVKKEEPVVEEKKEEPKKEEPKPASCTHPHMLEKVKFEGDCCHPAVYIIYCTDCDYFIEREGEINPDIHFNAKEYSDSPSCNNSYRSSFMHCDACRTTWKEVWADPTGEHVDVKEPFGYCDTCGAKFGGASYDGDTEGIKTGE